MLGLVNALYAYEFGLASLFILRFGLDQEKNSKTES